MGELFRKKNIMVVIITIFILTSVIPSVGSVKLEKNSGRESSLPNYQILNRDPDVYPVFNGTMGENGWYISPVNVTFVYDPQTVKTIYYSYNGTDEEYTGPFVIYLQGVANFYYNWTDYGGNASKPTGPIQFGIDYTPPEITFLTPENNTLYLFNQRLFHIHGISRIIGEMTINVAASDEYAGLINVSCTLMNVHNTITHVFDSAPFLWKLTGIHIGTYTLSTTAYNFAGLHTITTLQMRMLQFF